jgi:hypothetical protein
MSLTTSSIAAYLKMKAEYPQLAEWLHQPVHFSRQGEEAPDEAPSYPHPVFDTVDGKLFSKWNWNRVTSAQKLPGVPRISAQHREALERFDQVVRSPDLTHTMWLEPGDVRIINSHVTLHSRTDFVVMNRHRSGCCSGCGSLRPTANAAESWRVLYRRSGRHRAGGSWTESQRQLQSVEAPGAGSAWFCEAVKREAVKK